VKNEYPIQSVNNMSIFISHGEYDPVFPKELGDANHEYFNQHSRHVTYKTYPSAHEVPFDNKQDFTHWLQQDATSTKS
jgi:phospholipase/carboxylesterase